MTVTCAFALSLRESLDEVPVGGETSFGIVEERTADGERKRKSGFRAFYGDAERVSVATEAPSILQVKTSDYKLPGRI